MNVQVGRCDGCGASVPASGLALSMDPGRQRVCQACAIDEQRRSTKKGTMRQYLIGAAFLLLVLGYVAARVLIRMSH